MKGEETAMKTIGVVGAGLMGAGVAQNLAQTGHCVVLVDLTQDVLQRAEQRIRQDVRFQTMFNRAAAAADPDEIMSHIQLTTSYEDLARAEFVVENVTEKWEIKRPVYERLDAICRPEVVFAVNTSCISITKVGAVTRRPSQVLGMHFMNPVPLKDMAEVVRGFHTSEETIATARRFLAAMGKDCVVVNDLPGFVSNRVLMLTINEAAYVVQDQVASAADVDLIFKRCFEHKMGPLETGDLIGLDTILYSLEALYEGYNDPKYRPCPLLRKMVDAGLHGRKSGQGFHVYHV
jgi:3-hydroxybutyryl-CoA dehydrogenase